MVGAEDGMVVPEPGTEQEGIWVNAANVASYVELRMPRSIEVPIHLNLVFVGFDGHGRHDLAVSDRTVEHWFKHLDSLVHHTVLGEPHAAASGGAGSGHFDGGYSMHRALPPRHHAHAGALQQAERALNRFAGVGGVRYVLAIVLHACALGSPAGSLDRGRFVERRDQQLDWLEQRAPADESLRQQWLQMRAVK